MRELAPKAQRRRLRAMLRRPGPFPPTTAGEDFEGFPLFEVFAPSLSWPIRVSGKDFSRADARDAWVDRAVFADCTFAEADLRDAVFRRVRFERCTFRRTKLDRALFTYATTFDGCRIEDCRFTGGLRSMNGTFTDTHFVNCRLEHVDFGASSFAGCSFSGRLREVQFHGPRAAPHRRWRQRFDVDFSAAEVNWFNVHNGLDLSAVRLPPGWRLVRDTGALLAELRREHPARRAEIDELAEMLDLERQPQQVFALEPLRDLAPAIADAVWRASEHR